MSGEAFFIPVDPARFFEDNPFPEHGPPALEGLRFGAGCLSCGAQTDHTVTLVGGVRTPGHQARWEQPVPLCAPCLALRARRLRVLQGAALLALGLGSSGGVAALWAARELTGWGQLGLFAVLAVVAVLGTGVLWMALSEAVERWVLPRMTIDGRALSAYRPVDLFLFREPRKGDDTQVLCLSIDNDAQARQFAALNPHAIPRDRWNASYARLEAP